MMDEQEVEVIPQWVVKKIDDFFFAERVSWMMFFLFGIFFLSTVVIAQCLPGLFYMIDTTTAIASSDFGKVAVKGILSLYDVMNTFFLYLIMVILTNSISWYRDRK
jgi:hypothetical protein